MRKKKTRSQEEKSCRQVYSLMFVRFIKIPAKLFRLHRSTRQKGAVEIGLSADSAIKGEDVRNNKSTILQKPQSRRSAQQTLGRIQTDRGGETYE